MFLYHLLPVAPAVVFVQAVFDFRLEDDVIRDYVGFFIGERGRDTLLRGEGHRESPFFPV